MIIKNSYQRGSIFAKHIILLLFIIVFCNASCNAQKGITFKVLEIKKEINSWQEASITFRLINNTSEIIQIPNVIEYNNLYGKFFDLDIGYELYRKENNGKFVLLDSCFRLAQPTIPEEGILLKDYGKGQIFSCKSSLPNGCMTAKNKYKIRFTFFFRKPSTGKNKLTSKWFYINVNSDF